MTGEVDGCHVRIGRIQVGIRNRCRLGESCEVSPQVVVSHIHYLRLIVSRCTIYTVTISIESYASICLDDTGRQFLMRT